MRRLSSSCLMLVVAACGGGGGSAPTGSSGEATTDSETPTGTTAEASAGASAGELPDDGTTPIPAEPQRDGDPEKGYQALVNNGYVSCGIPWTAYSQVFGDAPEALRLPGRAGKSANLPYYQTAITAKSGIEIVTANCLQCHGGEINGQVVVGLGNAAADYTSSVGGTAALAAALLTDPGEKAELQRLVDRLAAVEPFTRTLTVGSNPADSVAAVLFAHRDPDTFEWFDPPLLPLPSKVVAPVDTPPWWWMKKKNAMFYVGAGRGDHARTMMATATLCTDDVAEAAEIDAYFPDVRAFILSIEAPPYPFAVDAGLASEGKAVFEATCSRCHGTYGAGGEYPNLLVDIEVVGTDDALMGAAQFADIYAQWFAESFYGEVARYEPQKGYMAPPLDGVWASAPYFHNGSVPTVAGVLESGARPKYWTRSFDSKDLDPAQLGWKHTALDHGQDDEPTADLRRKIYDTTKWGHGNGGHPFGDSLTAGERAAVIEYLKTL